jgi:hypothetical protein
LQWVKNTFKLIGMGEITKTFGIPLLCNIFLGATKKPACCCCRKGSSGVCLCVRYDAGFGNTLYIRGQGSGLSWERGIPLKNTAPDRWEWCGCGPCEFKLLIDDASWEDGPNRRIGSGEKQIITPKFA